MSAKTRKSVWQWMSRLIAAVVLIPAALLLFLYIPIVQQVGLQWLTAQLTERSGTDIHVGKLHLQFPLRLELQDVQIGTSLNIGQFDCNIRLRPLTQSTIEANYVDIRDITFRTDTSATTTQASIAAQRFRAEGISYHWREQTAHIHRILLADGDAAFLAKSSPKDRSTAPLRLPLSLSIADLRLLHIGASYTNSKTQLQGFVDEIALHIVAIDTTDIVLQSAEVKNGTISSQGSQLTQLTAYADSLHYSPTGFTGRITQLAFEESHGTSLQEGAITLAWHEGALSIPHLALRTTHSSFTGHLHIAEHSTEDATIKGDADIRLGYADAQLFARWTGIPAQFALHYPSQALSASISLEGTRELLKLTRCHIVLPTAFDITLSGTAQDITIPKQRIVQCHVEAATYDLDFLTAFTNEASINIPSSMLLQGELSYAADTIHTRCTLTLDNGVATLEAGYRPTNKTYSLSLSTDSLDLRHFLPHEEIAMVSLQAHLAGTGLDHRQETTSTHGTLKLRTLQWRDYTFSNAAAQFVVANNQLHAYAEYNDSLMRWNLTTSVKHTFDTIKTRLHAQITNLNMQALQITDTDIRPSLQCHATLGINSRTSYALRAHFTDITLSTPTQTVRPKALNLHAILTPDTALLTIGAGDLTLKANAHTEGLPWQWESISPSITDILSSHLSALQATLAAGSDNPVSNYLALIGIKVDGIGLTAHYTDNMLHAHLQSGNILWNNSQMHLQGRVDCTLAWGGTFAPDSLTGTLRLSNVRYSLSGYNLQLHTKESLLIPLERGSLLLTHLPLYTTERHPLLLDGKVQLFGSTPTAQLRLTAHDTDLLQSLPTRESQLYGKALVSGNISLNGPFNALSITGNLQLRPSSSIHYIYKDAILTASNQLDNVVTFTRFDTGTTPLPKANRTPSNLTMSLTISIDPTAQLGISLGASKQNSVAIQGGGMLNLQYASTTGLRLSGRYTIDTGTLNMNVPLLHVNSMTIRPGSSITWEGNPLNPLLSISAEDRIRASVTLDGSPQSVLFIAGVSLSDTMEKLNVQFTLAAPESASMQNTLATLSPEERGKLSVALLTTGLYLGEGGTGNLMNTALMGILQAQLDNISRDAFRTVDVSVGIEPLPDGVSGVSTRTDYSFSVAKRLWNNRIRIIIGGSVTTNNERIQEDAVIDNISIEWRITPVGNQYLRFFYEKNFENILEGEIRETGVGYAYRRKF